MGIDELLLHVDEEMPLKRQRTNEGDASTASAAEMSRISKSCDLCKMKKVKCDGGRPRCSFCVKNGSAECVYSIMKKSGLKPGYGKSMNERMDSLETELDALRQEMRFIREYQPQKYQPQMSISIDTITKTNASELTKFQLPHSHICLALIDLFFSEVIPMFPLIHPSVADEFKKGIQGGQEPTLLVYAVALISLKFLDDSQMKPQQKNIHYQNCKEKIITASLKKNQHRESPIHDYSSV
jgi:hypothetical protein